MDSEIGDTTVTGLTAWIESQAELPIILGLINSYAKAPAE
jgi:hypothetical protein